MNYKKCRKTKLNYLFCSLSALIFLSPLPYYFNISSSNTLGVTVILLAIYFFAYKYTIYFNKINDSIFIIILLIILHFIAVSLINNSIDLVRPFLSLLPLLALLYGGHSICIILSKTKNYQVLSSINKIFYFLLILGITSIITRFYYFSGDRVLFPFSEPSHYALVFIPFLMFKTLLCKDNFHRYFLVYLGITIGFLLDSFTLILGSILLISLIITIRSITLLLIPILVIFFAFDINFSYYMDRLMFLDVDTENLSALVYSQGWQLLSDSLYRSNFLGLGFQQLGVVEVLTDSTIVIQGIIGEVELPNQFDGGFTFAKYFSEFGIFGILPFYYYITYLFNSFFQLRKFSQNKLLLNPSEIFCNIVIFTSLLEIFLRGIGYFSISFVLLAMALFFKFNNFSKSIL